nr:hypothetical protein CTI12_AA386970 [Tanacetum cinerariifolium]
MIMSRLFIVLLIVVAFSGFMVNATPCKTDKECDDVNCPETICFYRMCICALEYEGGLPPYIQSRSTQDDNTKLLKLQHMRSVLVHECFDCIHR